MKIFHFHFGKEGGAERFFVNLINSFAERGVEQVAFIRPDRTLAPGNRFAHRRSRKSLAENFAVPLLAGSQTQTPHQAGTSRCADGLDAPWRSLHAELSECLEGRAPWRLSAAPGLFHEHRRARLQHTRHRRTRSRARLETPRRSHLQFHQHQNRAADRARKREHARKRIRRAGRRPFRSPQRFSYARSKQLTAFPTPYVWLVGDGEEHENLRNEQNLGVLDRRPFSRLAKKIRLLIWPRAMFFACLRRTNRSAM